ncbi:MAG TPA: hypothetical protein IAC47_05295 [Candidatus Onthomorpha intestinigallinarum]|uniref:Uncharacterized protein n=1 Tax=Candidatus Onthomorpha intestinigallinarum TaxID=2840880 RepID=A0A9D1RJD6_9BACT|nr:hypothetical protein [Candidatus Onthomorpha intestinigallinarum]
MIRVTLGDCLICKNSWFSTYRSTWVCRLTGDYLDDYRYNGLFYCENFEIKQEIQHLKDGLSNEKGKDIDKSRLLIPIANLALFFSWTLPKITSWYPKIMSVCILNHSPHDYFCVAQLNMLSEFYQSIIVVDISNIPFVDIGLVDAAIVSVISGSKNKHELIDGINADDMLRPHYMNGAIKLIGFDDFNFNVFPRITVLGIEYSGADAAERIHQLALKNVNVLRFYGEFTAPGKGGDSTVLGLLGCGRYCAGISSSFEFCMEFVENDKEVIMEAIDDAMNGNLNSNKFYYDNKMPVLPGWEYEKYSEWEYEEY